MYEKVNPCHPDKVADRIAGAIVDLCYAKSENPKVACEVLIGHGECNIQVETSEQISAEDIVAIVERIAGDGIETRALIVPQDIHLAANQRQGVRCGDNGIFKGVPPTFEQQLLTDIAASMYEKYGTDGKYLIRACHGMERTKKCRGNYNLTICQSNEESPAKLHALVQSVFDKKWPFVKVHNNLIEPGPLFGFDAINPLGEWTGGPNTDSGATNRKLGSDMGDGVTGGGLMGKDLSKADVSVNIWTHLQAQKLGRPVEACCSIGDETVCGIPYADIVAEARDFIFNKCGGFEKFAEWGLLRP